MLTRIWTSQLILLPKIRIRKQLTHEFEVNEAHWSVRQQKWSQKWADVERWQVSHSIIGSDDYSQDNRLRCWIPVCRRRRLPNPSTPPIHGAIWHNLLRWTNVLYLVLRMPVRQDLVLFCTLDRLESASILTLFKNFQPVGFCCTGRKSVFVTWPRIKMNYY